VERFLLPRLKAAAQQALGGWAAAGGCGAAGVTDLIVGGLTAPRATPGPDALLAQSLGLPPHVRRVPLHHLGCLGGYRALALAADIARGDPHACVLVVYGDVSSLIGASLQSPMNEADLLSVAIFSDGAAAALVGGSAVAAALGSTSERGPAAARIVASRSGLLRSPGGESTEQEMWLRETGFRADGSIYGQNFVGKAVPKHLLRTLPRFVGDMLTEARRQEAEHGAGRDTGALQPMGPLSDMTFLCHPGGPAILDVATRALELQPWQLEHSWRVLRERGNMSGATNLFVVHHWLQAGAPGARHAAGVAFGPGLAVEGVLLEAL
jgi:alkylresorcinol/alkylpyrone synthase